MAKYIKVTCKEPKILPEIVQAEKKGYEVVCVYLGKRDYEIILKKKAVAKRKKKD